MIKVTLIATLMAGFSLTSQAQVETLPPQKTTFPMSQMCIEDICIGQTIGYMPTSRARPGPAYEVEGAKAIERFKALQTRAPYCKDTKETVYLALPSGRLAMVTYSAFPLPTGAHMSVTSVWATAPGNFTEKQITEVFDTLNARMKFQSDQRQAKPGRHESSGTFMPWNLPAHLSVSETTSADVGSYKKEKGMEVYIYLDDFKIGDRLAAQPHCTTQTPVL